MVETKKPFNVLLGDTELERIRAVANKAGESVSGYMRRQVLLIISEEESQKTKTYVNVSRIVRKPNTYVIGLDDGNELYLNKLKDLDKSIKRINEIQNE